jgi:hypothetical protein
MVLILTNLFDNYNSIRNLSAAFCTVDINNYFALSPFMFVPFSGLHNCDAQFVCLDSQICDMAGVSINYKDFILYLLYKIILIS